MLSLNSLGSALSSLCMAQDPWAQVHSDWSCTQEPGIHNPILSYPAATCLYRPGQAALLLLEPSWQAGCILSAGSGSNCLLCAQGQQRVVPSCLHCSLKQPCCHTLGHKSKIKAMTTQRGLHSASKICVTTSTMRPFILSPT